MKERIRMPINEIALRITNSQAQDLIVHLEPWGEQYRMAAGATFKVDAKGPDGDNLELEYGDGRITVYGWSGSTVAISVTDTAAKNS
jgi:hypothetical protein